MPLPKRVISPVYVSRDTLPEHLQLSNDLEGVTNGTLSNIIRQLSSLSHHAEDIFGELYKEAETLHNRSSNLQARIDRLAVKVTQLDSTVEEVSLQDIHLRKAFRSSVVFDQQVVSKQTIPTAMADTYHHCDKPPPLDKLNVYRDDGKDGLKFYTDPDYFFDLWRQEMLKDTERILNDKGRKPHRGRTEGSSGGGGGSAGGGGSRHKKRVRQPHNTREKHREMAINKGEYISPQNALYQSPQALYLEDGTMLPDPSSTSSRPPRPNSIEVKRNYHGAAGQAGSHNNNNHDAHGESVYAGRQQGQQQRSPQDNTYNRQNHSPGTSLSNHSTPTRGSRATNSNHQPMMVGMGTPNSQMMGRESLPPPPPPPASASDSVDRYSGYGSHLPNPPYISSVMVNSGAAAMTGTPPPPPPPLPPPGSVSYGLKLPPLGREARGSSSESELPLPPPPPLPDTAPPDDGGRMRIGGSSSAAPPPPPPPPMPTMSPPRDNGRVIVTNGDVNSKVSNSVSPPKGSPGRGIDEQSSSPMLQPAKRGPSIAVPALDGRSDLLKAIRDGISLRKVEKGQQREVEKSRGDGLHDVASILARRVAMEISDSESGSESGSGSDWDDETSA